MVVNIIIRKSDKPDKKYDAIIDDKKTISFGQKNASDFTLHKDPVRKQRYLNRHRDNENWRDYKTAGFYATNILWNKPTIRESIADVNNKFKNLHVVLK
jgi:hypothetical protein